MAFTFEPTVVVVGSVNLDTTVHVAMLPVPGETVFAATNHQQLGGKGANQAVAAAEAGATVTIVCALGDDPAAEQALGWLRSRAVEVRPVRDQTRPTGQAWIIVDDKGENAIVVDRGANAALTADLAIAAVLDRTRGSDRTTTTLVAQGEVDPAVVHAVAAFAREHGLRFVLNLAPVIEVSEATLRTAAPLIVNEGEATALTRRHLGEDSRPADLARRWGIDIVITLGAEGAAIISPDGEIRRVPAPLVDVVVDTSGAGDAFAGTVAAALSRGLSLYEAAEHGVAAGARAVRRWGASGIGDEQGSNR
ncbi:PfkB family carbohydrate kinase [Nonomuraea jiangxiensis]|uniref:Ribokinase n=1 Tax=Nonomuraea jiangxiensis TaxID=633440 RepID=A0A1G9Q6M8_9ACTN|nr:PfkB family carbohydrate kinase [Nonomuraea jiangxiensis]SDM06593.1 ribokinase [Nonomuraea jiangxiensis]